MIWVVKLKVREWSGAHDSVPASVVGIARTVEEANELIEQDVKSEHLYHSNLKRLPGISTSYKYIKHHEHSDEQVILHYVKINMQF